MSKLIPWWTREHTITAVGVILALAALVLVSRSCGAG